MKIKALPQEERPMEKAMARGIGILSNAELVAILLGSGTTEKSAIGLAEEVIGFSDEGIAYLASCTLEELMSLKGIGPSKAVRLAAAGELGKRIATTSKKQRERIGSAEDIAGLFMETMRYEKRESFKALLLNAKGEILAIETVSVGDLTSTPVHPREAFTQAIKRSAAAVVFVHNHPSGDPSPSGDDFETTRMLVECGNLLRIRVLDHIIIGDGIFSSMAGLGYL